jgi:hypothetical protein
MTSEMNEEYELKQSIAKLGRLTPIIKDASGHIIDGLHRQKLDSKWEEEFSVTLESIKDPVQLLLARLAINVCRRQVPNEEKTRMLDYIAKQTDWTPQQIAEATGMSYQWVCRYLSEEFKDKEMADLGKRGAEAKAEDVAIRRIADSESISKEPIGQEDVKIEHSLEPEQIPTLEESKPQPVDMGKIFHCDICKKDYTIIHVDEGKHRFEQVTVG